MISWTASGSRSTLPNCGTDRNYEYNDLGFYMIARIVERLSGQPLDEYVDQHFYR